VVHEFASLTAPLDPAQPGRSPQHSLACGSVARGTNTWKTPRRDLRRSRKDRALGGNGGLAPPAQSSCSTSSLRSLPPSPGYARRVPPNSLASGSVARGTNTWKTPRRDSDDPARIERWGVPGGSRPLHDQTDPRVRFAHRPPRRATPGVSPQTPSLRSVEGGQTNSLPPGAKRRWGEWRSRRRRRGGPSRLLHEFGPLTTPSLRSVEGRQTNSLPPGAKRHWGEQPRRQARRGGPSQEQCPRVRSAHHPLAPLGRGGTNKLSPPRSEATLGGAASPPGEARGAVPRAVSTSSVRSPPPRSARSRGDKQTLSPQERSDIGGSSLAARRGEGGRPKSSVHEFGPLTTPSLRSVEGGQTNSLPPGAKRHWGEQPRRQARRGGPSQEQCPRVRSAHHPLAPLGRGGTNKLSPPRSEATLGGVAEPQATPRGAVKVAPRVRSAHRRLRQNPYGSGMAPGS
jgi:hypothetical protein